MHFKQYKYLIIFSFIIILGIIALMFVGFSGKNNKKNSVFVSISQISERSYSE